MKKAIIIFFSVIFILFLAILLVPIIFKTQIRDAVNKTLTESVNAEVVWDPTNFSLSLLSNFPNATAGLSELGIVNRAPFEGQVFLTVENAEVEINLISLLGDEIKIEGISLIEPVVYLRVNEDGAANYDIAVESESPAQETGSGTEQASISIDHWEITDGYLEYSDAQQDLKMVLRHITHNGSGNLQADVFDLNTYTISDSASFSFGGTEYISNKRLEGDITLTISDNYSHYDFSENYLKINELHVGMDGQIALPDEAVEMDLTISALDNTFKSLLSLVPGIYNDQFDEITSEGTLDLSARIHGRMDSLTNPAFEFHVATSNASFRYPDLPDAVNNISLDLEVVNQDGVMENTRVALNTLHFEFGDNPVDARVIVENLRNYPVDAAVNAELNFDEITRIFPTEGITLRGMASVDLTAKGIYDSLENVMPVMDGTISISEGFLRTEDLPYALEDLTLSAAISNPTGQMMDFLASIDNFSMAIDGAPFQLSGEIRNLVNYTWNLDATGKLDLSKVDGLLGLENMEVAGILNADVHTRGNVQALEAERYGELPTSGSMALMNFSYRDNELPYTVTVSEAAAAFTPGYMELQQLNGTVGESDFSATGRVENYLGYIFEENQVVRGNLDIKSKYINLNEFMEEDTDAGAPAAGDSVVSVIPVPANVDLTITSSLAQVDVLDLSLTNASGRLNIANESLDLNGLSFNMLGGGFGVNGVYSTRNKSEPRYEFGLDVNKISIAQSFKAFEMVRKFAPVAEQLTGTYSADFNISGLLNEDMTAKLNSVDASGMLEVMQATLQNSEILTGIASLTSLNTPSELTLSDVLMSFQISDGKLLVKPFNFNLGGYPATVEGATAIDGSIAYKITMDVPASRLGSTLSGFLSQAGVSKSNGKEVIPVTIGLGGTYEQPEPRLMMQEQKDQVEDALKEEAKEQAEDLITDLLGKKTVPDSVAADSLKQDSTQTDLQEEATKVIKDLFKRKKKNDGDQ